MNIISPLMALLLVMAATTQGHATAGPRSIRDFGVLPENSPELNRANLQNAIDWASPLGAALFVEPSDEPYRLASGIILKKNVSLVGVHGPVGRGTSHPSKRQPVGSVLACEDDAAPLLTVEGATQIRGIQFWYPKQNLRDPAKVIAYPPTIKASQAATAQGVTLSCLTFYGEYFAMDFRCTPEVICEQVLIEHCYGYPLSGQFVAIDYCYDIPRVLHCHVNPANMRLFGGHFSREVIDATVAKGTFAYWIDHTDNAVLMDLFTFATYGGVYLGSATYGQLTNFNLDCVTVGVHKLGDSKFNRNWQLAQGSIIANIGKSVEEVHPIIIEGQGHTSMMNVESFSGPNGAVTAIGMSNDFLLIRGSGRPTVSLVGCRMRNYAAASPITFENPHALVQAMACVDKDEKPFNLEAAN